VSPPPGCGPAVALSAEAAGDGTLFRVTRVNQTQGPWRVADLAYAFQPYEPGRDPDGAEPAPHQTPLGEGPLVVRAGLVPPDDALDAGDALEMPHAAGNLILFRGGQDVGGTWACL